ncbi:glycine betaine ABC transporter substrate-binding protein [Williamsia sp. CHRR-6]|uniref:glycine betaine ABC transporter substrate-binding protein n=1 Tax=Williamsia sp. CHRR-6 TaxID=2835871 RepID=UPI002023D955|nr:glycine betaine ABC transporter substrate-binding protein [Williamsia sp. CHRR-6]
MSTDRSARRLAPVLSAAAMVLSLSMLTGCGSTTPSAQPLVVGSAPGTAAGVAAQIYAEVLRHTGARVADEMVSGSYGALLADLDEQRVDLFPAFSGALLTELAPGSTSTATDAVYGELNAALPQGVSVGDATTVTDQLQVVVSAAVAQAAGDPALADCGRLPVALPLLVTTTPDPSVLRALDRVGCRFAPPRVVATVSELTAEVAAGRAAALISTLSTVGNDPALRSLADTTPAADPRGTITYPVTVDPAQQPAIRAQDLLPVFSTAALSRDQIKAINKVAGELSTADLATMAQQVTDDPASRAAVVGAWLAEHNL